MRHALRRPDVDFIELNISCPNVKQGGHCLRHHARTAPARWSARVRKVCTVPLIVKAEPPGREHPRDVHWPCEAAGRRHQPCATPSRPAPSIWKSAARCSTTPSRACPARRCGPSPCAWCGRLCGAVQRARWWAWAALPTGRRRAGVHHGGRRRRAGGHGEFRWTRTPASPHHRGEIDQWMDAHGVKTLDEIRGVREIKGFPRGR